MLHLIGLGLHDVTDITVKGLERVRACDHVYAEFYTAILGGTGVGDLDDFLGVPVEVLDRQGVEEGAKEIVEQARTSEVALLTAGDPLTATTHTDLMVRCKEAGVEVRIVHAPSIYAAAPGLVGLQHYKFGRTTTLVRPEANWSPTSPFEAVASNRDAGLHTLVLLDIKADEAYFMHAHDGLKLLLELAERTGNTWFNMDAQAAIVARAGSDVPFVATGTVRDLLATEPGDPLHTIVIPGEMHAVEEEAWNALAANAQD